MNSSELPTQLEAVSYSASERSTELSKPSLPPERTLFLSALLLTSSFMTLVLVSLPQIVAQFMPQAHSSSHISPAASSLSVAPQPHPDSDWNIQIGQLSNSQGGNPKKIAIIVTPSNPPQGSNPGYRVLPTSALKPSQSASIQVILHP